MKFYAPYITVSENKVLRAGANPALKYTQIFPPNIVYYTFEINLIHPKHYGNMCTTKRGTPQENGGL